MGASAARPVGRPGAAWLPAAGVLLLAVNLRPAVSAVGAVVPELRDDVGLSAALTGLLLALPMAAFAVAGLGAPALGRRIGAHRTVLVALAALTAGQLLRAALPGAGWLFAGSLLGLAGIALANVVLPALVRDHFPGRIAGMTAAYTTALTAGAAASAALTIPVQQWLGGDWRTGLGSWAAVSAVALLPWLGLLRDDARPPAASPARLPVRRLVRSPVAWTLTAYFGSQAMLAYVILGWLPEILTGRGMGQAAAAAHVSVVVLVGLVPSALAPAVLARSRRPAAIVVVLTGCYVAGFAGLALAPQTSLAWVWAVLIGVGNAAFPVALTLISLRSRHPQTTTSLSAFVQCVGYALAAGGPVLFGLVGDLSGGWSVPLALLCGVAVLQGAAGVAAVRPRFVEDDLAW